MILIRFLQPNQNRMLSATTTIYISKLGHAKLVYNWSSLTAQASRGFKSKFLLGLTYMQCQERLVCSHHTRL
ncbi:hypothetical protein BDZ94DRAFT_1247577 [Collybia nuda]|uniref:Uncharacterized protein n=1 Tax=Collybia nuda TaxID=64659 RepID=A0A9P6CPJ3_9AGAR|nr:hypothetical protein BDZ94DRAFT_1247577 [Collybia nuda]